MTETLTHADIRDLLKGFGAAIELDQLRVDAVPAAKFHPSYNDSMWRRWRADHIVHINRLLTTVDAIPAAMLGELAGIAIAYKPDVIGHIMLELFAEAVGGSCPEQELGTAERLFGWLVSQVGKRSEGGPRHRDARTAISKWLSVTDPLRIAQDPECGYGQPAGFIS
jgi:hypothetical protein